MPIQPLVNAKILIVEEQPLALSYMKQSLERLDFRHLKFAENASAAKELCKVDKFDLVICSFDLSKRQNGYQLYEELKSKRLIRRYTAFIFISSESSPELVHSVLELQPDDFLVKPFTIKDLQQRIERVLKRKYALKKIFTLLDDGNDSKALKHINLELDNSNHTYTAMLLKLKGETFLKLERYDDAKNFFKSMLELQKFTWAKLGLVETYIANKDYSIAQKMLKALISSHDTRLPALDLLSRLELELDQLENAQHFLQEAASIAPRNLDRQKSLSQVAQLNHDYEISYLAQKDIATYARHSIHDSPQIYLNAARAGIDFALSTDQPEVVNRLTRQTQQYLSELKKQFPNADNQTQIDVLNARLHYLKDESKHARQLIEQLDDDIVIRSIDDALDKAKALHELGFHHKAQTLFEQIIVHCERHSALTDPVTLRYVQQQQTERKDITMGPRELNNHAVNQFNRGQLQTALEAFTQAFRIMPKNASIALNLLQCLCDSSAKSGMTFNSQLAQKCHAILKSALLEEEQAKRYEQLRNKLTEMKLLDD